MILNEGISRVRAFALPVGVGGDGKTNQLAGFAVVKWYSTYGDMQHQVYINGKLAGVTTEPSQRQMVVSLPMSQQAAVRIEVFAVDLQNANTDFSESIGTELNQSRIRIEFPKMIDGCIDIYHADEKLNKETIKISEYIGFGLSGFGASDFGFDGSGAIGFGKGAFGYGKFGFDADLFCWQSEQLETGNYQLNVKVTDDNGNESEIETETLTLIGQAEPAGKLAIDSFDKQGNKLIISTL